MGIRNRKKRVFFTNARRQAGIGLLFVSFFLCGLLFFFLPAVVRSLMLCFAENNASFDLTWVGWKNFHYLFRVDPDFLRDIVESIGGLLVDAAVIIFYSIFISTLLNREMKGRGVLRALLFLPVVMSMGVIENYMNFSAESAGALPAAAASPGSGFSMDSITSLLLSFSLSRDITAIIVGAIQNIYSIISRSGVQVIIFLAGLQSINKSIYEAAKTEGCGAWETYWKITIPMLSPVILVNVVYTVVDSFVSSGNVVMNRVLGYLTKSFQFGLASAAGWVYFILLIVLVVLVMAVLRKFIYYENVG